MWESSRVGKKQGTEVLFQVNHRVAAIYKRLIVALDIIEEQLTGIEDLAARSCLVVLEDDLRDLMAECEEYLVCPDDMPSRVLPSLHSRSETVLNELRYVLKQ